MSQWAVAMIQHEDPLSVWHLGGLIPHLLHVLMLDTTRSRLHPSNVCTHSSFPQSMTILFWYPQEKGVLSAHPSVCHLRAKWVHYQSSYVFPHS